MRWHTWQGWRGWHTNWRLGHLSDSAITRYLAGELSLTEMDEAQGHLVRCQRCARACEDQQLAHHLLRGLSPERSVPAALDARLRAELAQRTLRGAAQPLRFLRAAHTRPARRLSAPAGLRRGSAFWSLAAVLLIALASAFVFGDLRSTGRREPVNQPQQATVPGWSCNPPATLSVPSVWQWSRPNISLNAIAMLSPDAGWAVGEYNGSRGLIINFGAGVWTVHTTTSNAVLRGIAMDGPDDGWAVGEDCTHPGRSLMLHYHDGIWSHTQVPNVGPLTSVAMASKDEGWAAGEQGLLRYTNGIWVPTATGAQAGAPAISALALAAPGSGWAVGPRGAILRESAHHWMAPPTGFGPDALGPDWSALAVLPDGAGWAVGSYGVGGQGVLGYNRDGEWELTMSPASDPLYGVSLDAFDDGWAVGGDETGVILRLRDGVWHVARMPWTPGLRAVAMVSPTEAWAVGREGAIMHLRQGVWEPVTCEGF